MNMTDNKTRTITYYKLKYADDETRKFYGSTENLENRKKTTNTHITKRRRN
jgi:hypothetical protein